MPRVPRDYGGNERIINYTLQVKVIGSETTGIVVDQAIKQLEKLIRDANFAVGVANVLTIELVEV